MVSTMVQIKNYLTPTAVNKEHLRSKEMETEVSGMAIAFGGSLDDWDVMKGVATFRVSGEGVGDKIIEEFKKIDGVEACHVVSSCSVS